MKKSYLIFLIISLLLLPNYAFSDDIMLIDEDDTHEEQLIQEPTLKAFSPLTFSGNEAIFKQNSTKISFPDSSVVTFWQSANKIMGLRHSGRRYYRLQRRIRRAQTNVIGYRVDKKEVVLKHKRELLHQGVRLHITQIHAANTDMAFVRVGVTQQQARHGAFSGTAWPDQRHNLPGRHMKAHLLQRGASTRLRIMKAHLLKGNARLLRLLVRLRQR